MKKIFNYILMMMPLMASVTLTSCETDEEIANYLINGNWEGYLGTYYVNRWGEEVKDREYRTVWRFEGLGYDNRGYVTSGIGYEVDYDTYNRNEYAYSPFHWSVNNGDIYITYDDPTWSPVTIDWVDYSISWDYFRGTMYDWDNRAYDFDLTNRASWDWNNYRSNYYRTRAAENGDDDVYISENGASVATGRFAKALKRMAGK